MPLETFCCHQRSPSAQALLEFIGHKRDFVRLASTDLLSVLATPHAGVIELMASQTHFLAGPTSAGIRLGGHRRLPCG
jgi:hypothetical protein